VPVLTERHAVLLVGGLGSSSENAAVADVDTKALGYRADDVVRFSYSDGETYTAQDTTGDISVSAHRFAQRLIALAAETSTPIDVIAHSLGGLVVRAALAELATSRPDVLQRLGTVVTLGTPHRGADLASLVTAMNSQPVGQFTLDQIGRAAGLPLSPDDPAVQQLAPGSDFLRALPARPPANVRFVSIAARGDLIVPAPRAHLDGAVNVIVPIASPTAHDELPGSADATREIGLAMNGADPTCETAVDAVLDATSGGLISRVEHTLAVTQGG
jgi:pimeloyl-ACP methyl ester carboxylesterase